MAGLRAFLGLFPDTTEFENNRIKLEEEYNALLEFKNSTELKKYFQLEKHVKSEEFDHKRKEILSLRFKQTEDFSKEKRYEALTKSKDIKLYYQTKNSQDLVSFFDIESSKELKKYYEFEKFINSSEFAKAKKEASLPAKQKFQKSDLYKTLTQYNQAKSSAQIKGYYKFINSRLFSDFESVKNTGLNLQVAELEKEINAAAFLTKKASMKKSDFKTSPEQQKLIQYNNLKKSKAYRNYLKMANSPYRRYYDELHQSQDIDAYADLAHFISSDDFKRQKKEIELKSFKDTKEYVKLQDFISLKNSEQIKFYFKFKNSKEYRNFMNLDGSERISDYEKLKTYIESDEFVKNKTYYTQSPKSRWEKSEEYKLLNQYESLKSSEKIVWYFKNIDSKKFAWHRIWSETFIDDFASAKLDTKKWITRYYWGDKILKDSYSLSQDKHFVTDGENIEIHNSRLQIVTRKEAVKGKSWHQSLGFVTRDFGYTSGLVNTAKSFRQVYGTFEAKMRFHPSSDLLNAFWMVSHTIIPHIDIAKAFKKVIVGNAWGNPKNLKGIKRFSKSFKRSKLSSDFFIYSLEWTSHKMIWKINGLEVASTSQGIPQEPMYLALSAGLQRELDNVLPAKFEIDWVRCFQHKDH